ncbi:ATP-grasp domain-containing protein [Sphingobium sp.]|uniref:ATP-grasp domain-containing protein n=1 Tax=Sphingobium sp. TaxID=1912891 RepID=UPI002D0F5A6B|nr:ATP-grasp domain-containing protein [Sphingobium sp.]HUD91504.1 ATP-grasp domain-containing protein [Sphingobium sp.]
MHQMTGDRMGEIKSRSTTRRRLTILLCSAGRRVELLIAFRRAAGHLGVDLQIIACDLQPEWSAACRFADKSFRVPRADDPDYVPAIEAICRDHGVGLVVPTIDPELQPLADARARFAGLGAWISVSDPELVAICRDKLLTASFLNEHGVPVPRTLAWEDMDPKTWIGPAIIKPRGGSAGRSILKIDDMDELPVSVPEPMIVQELLRGEEWTVNLYFDDRGILQSVVPHHRVQVRAGEVEKGVTGRPSILLDMAEKLAAALPGARGALCYQAIITPDGSAKLFEINARFGGGYPLAESAGASFAQWLIEARMGMPSSAGNSWTEGVMMLRYDAAIFVSP